MPIKPPCRILLVNNFASIIHIRGGGDLASGVTLRLHRAGLHVLITEQPQPLAVRRLVSFAEAVYRGQTIVEEVTARCVQSAAEANRAFSDGEIPVFVDPEYKLVNGPESTLPKPLVLIDARMTKHAPDLGMDAAPLVIGLGPGCFRQPVSRCLSLQMTMVKNHL
jgi:xanthine dehydrogenase accessory factor